MGATTVKERPILFSGPMVRAILDGRKTQTRRIVKWRWPYSKPDWYEVAHQDGGGNWIFWSKDSPNLADFTKKVYPNGEGVKCPYGQPGDRLYVRTWAKQLDGKYIYRADHQDWELADYTATGNWKPSIHMPRAASRITLQITGIRAERLHDISEADAYDEGFEWVGHGDISPLHQFEKIWQKINGPDSWNLNPWVWVVSFKRIENTV